MVSDTLACTVPVLWDGSQWKAVVAFAVLVVALLAGSRQYRNKLTLAVLDDAPRLVQLGLAALGLTTVAIVLRHDPAALAPFVAGGALSLVLLLAGRAVCSWVVLRARAHGFVRHRTVLIGDGPRAASLLDSIAAKPELGLDVVLHLEKDVVSPRSSEAQARRHRALLRLVRAYEADVVILANADAVAPPLLAEGLDTATRSVDVFVVSQVSWLRMHGGRVDRIGALPLERIGRPTLDGPAMAVKRATDVLVSSVALILAAPVMLVLALAVRMSGEGGILFRQERIGRGGVAFDCLKFRSMRPASVVSTSTTWSGSAEPRVTRIGAVMRRLSLDELPQLFNVLRGDMSLVGPRPERPHFVELFSREHDLYARRHRMPAGLTGLSQVSGYRGDTSIAQRAEYDNYYIENWSLWLDAVIIVRTVAQVVLAKGS